LNDNVADFSYLLMIADRHNLFGNGKRIKISLHSVEHSETAPKTIPPCLMPH